MDPMYLVGFCILLMIFSLMIAIAYTGLHAIAQEAIEQNAKKDEEIKLLKEEKDRLRATLKEAICASEDLRYQIDEMYDKYRKHKEQT